jgi:uncharacterized protein YgbK (DUF1537 family)
VLPLNETNLSLQNVLSSLPPYDAPAVSRRLDDALLKLDRKIVVLDDDPTGVQTVNGIHVYTDWTEESIRDGLLGPNSMFFILTNSRSFDRAKTAQVHDLIARRVVNASRETGKAFLLVSRSDSTLRGHYPLETETLRQTLKGETGRPVDGEVILPFFLEGGRYTIGNVHYVAAGDELVPAGQTEFAGDKTFGYVSSDLREWIEEKSAGAYSREQVAFITLEELRACDYKSIERKLMDVSGFGKVIVNSVSYEDVEVFVTALASAIGRGKEFLFRSAAALTRVLGGIKGRELLSREELTDPKWRG